MNEQDIELIKQYPDAFKSTLEMVRKVDFTLKASGIVQKEPVTWQNCPCTACQIYRNEQAKKTTGGEAGANEHR
jgi:hypothetical protein